MPKPVYTGRDKLLVAVALETGAWLQHLNDGVILEKALVETTVAFLDIVTVETNHDKTPEQIASQLLSDYFKRVQS